MFSLLSLLSFPCSSTSSASDYSEFLSCAAKFFSNDPVISSLPHPNIISAFHSPLPSLSFFISYDFPKIVSTILSTDLVYPSPLSNMQFSSPSIFHLLRLASNFPSKISLRCITSKSPNQRCFLLSINPSIPKPQSSNHDPYTTCERNPLDPTPSLHKYHIHRNPRASPSHHNSQRRNPSNSKKDSSMEDQITIANSQMTLGANDPPSTISVDAQTQAHHQAQHIIVIQRLHHTQNAHRLRDLLIDLWKLNDRGEMVIKQKLKIKEQTQESGDNSETVDEEVEVETLDLSKKNGKKPVQDTTHLVVKKRRIRSKLVKRATPISKEDQETSGKK